MYKKYEQNKTEFDEMAAEEFRRFQRATRLAFVGGLLTLCFVWLYKPKPSYYVDEYGQIRPAQQTVTYDYFGNPYQGTTASLNSFRQNYEYR